MKRITNLAISLAVFSFLSSAAFADGNAFTPLNFDDTTPVAAPVAKAKVAPAPKAAPEKAVKDSSSNPFSNALSKVVPQKTEQPTADKTASGQPPIGNEDIQNAILQLDNAQVGIRNDLLNYKAKYADLDAQFKLIKNERSVLHRQITTIERRIRNIDRQKEQIRRNMI